MSQHPKNGGLNLKDQADWRRRHIPHRVRAGIARLDMSQSILQVKALVDPELPSADHRIYWRCATDSIWEGRLAATRWLIEFVGVRQARSGKPALPKRRGADVGIDDFGGGCGNLFDLSITPDAYFLADVWKGCSQATSHATHNSNHPSVNEADLSKALELIVRHLQDTIYQPAGENIRDYVLELPPP